MSFDDLLTLKMARRLCLPWKMCTPILVFF